jgi:hypothetical protein
VKASSLLEGKADMVPSADVIKSTIKEVRKIQNLLRNTHVINYCRGITSSDAATFYFLDTA